MLKHIAIVTIVVNQLSAVETPWRQELAYTPVQRGVVSAEQAALWAAPAMTGKPFVIMGPASGSAVYLRFIEDKAAVVPAPGTTFGWNAVELLVTDPDRLASQLQGSAFRVIGPPRDLWPAPDAPRAMQAFGPAGELIYFTRVIPSAFKIPMAPAESPVDRVFIMVVGGPSMTAMQDWYRDALGLKPGPASAWQIKTLSQALNLPAETTYQLSIAPMPRDFEIELDEYPAVSVPRQVREGSLPPGIAMVSIGVERLDQLRVDWRAPPARLAEFPYKGQAVGVTVGPAGEWLEFIELEPSASPK
ncbi:MAG: hypothetical protein KJ049_03265 [Gammaproteobacteria bacterium]|jgi:hypothetical protein|nr:hypothetical protein [Gammaproteobacteria bacterium]